MIPLAAAFVLVLAPAALFLWALAPQSGRAAGMRPFEERFVAHRGLFDNGSAAPENSLPAFAAAVRAGYGIELDVQRTADGALVVFHDENLRRMCGVDAPLHRKTLVELQALRLLGSGEPIPLFSDVLALVAGAVPMIVEIKGEGDWRRTTAETAAALDAYAGVYCVESFEPGVLRWFRRHRPAVLRGQLSMDYFKHRRPEGRLRKWLLTDLLCNGLSRPDFIAYDLHDADRFAYRVLRTLFPSVVRAAWTVRSEADLAAARRVATCFIFDSFRPPAPSAEGRNGTAPKGITRRPCGRRHGGRAKKGRAKSSRRA